MPFKFAVNQNPLTIEFEAGSIKEGIAILQQEETALGEFFATALKLTQGGGEASEPAANSAEPAKRRGRPAKDASAPPPAPVPGATATVPPPVPAAAPVPPAPAPAAAPVGDALAIPEFLQRQATPPVPPPTPAAPPPAAPVAPKLAHKVIEVLKKRAEGSADQGQAFASWLVQCGLVNNTTPPPTLTEVIEVIQFLDDSKLVGVASQLGVA